MPDPSKLARKAELDAADEGGEPVLDINYPPHEAPLYWEEFKAWARVHMPDYSLAVIDEQVADPVTAAALQCYRAGRTLHQNVDFAGWAATSLHIRSRDPMASMLVDRSFLAGRAARWLPSGLGQNRSTAPSR